MRENLKNFTLLYAEDDKSIQVEMLEYFSSYFKEVYVANDGKEALEIYKQNKPDVMILDIYMPHLSGLELAKILRENDYKTKIVLITAFSKDSIMLEAININININFYITKPATLQNIKQMLDKIALDLSRSSSMIVEFKNNISFNLSSKQLLNKNEEIKLSKKESDLLELFCKNINKSIKIEDIMAYCWSDINFEVSLESVKSLVSNLRKKLPKDSILNIYGVGYMLKK